MSQVTVFRVQATPLAVSEVVSLLKNPPVDGVPNLPPATPEAIYQSDDDTEQGMTASSIKHIPYTFLMVEGRKL